MALSDLHVDHRPRVAAERRARMRRALVESALLVFAEKGLEASVIDDVIRAADVSRGSFYNHFRTNAELLHAANEELSNEIASAIETVVLNYASPTARLIVGVRMYMGVARRFPLFAAFLAQVGLHFVGPGNLLYAYLPVHIEMGFANGEFRRTPMLAALDAIVGAGVLAVTRIARGEADEDYLAGLLLALMRGLGVADSVTAGWMAIEQPALEFADDSLLERSHRRFTALQDASSR
ncbi:MAG: TetR/AcrR family transcriptional regulator [Beijerinckiaceae bacterium]